MNVTAKKVLLASSIIGVAALSMLGAQARWGGGPRDAIATTPQSGGYCDFAGCPDHFWRYPVHYGPVFFHGRWYQGPVYFRGDRWARQYWVQGGWHRDEWRGPRPGWAQVGRDGPPLPFEYYMRNGFRLGDHWRRQHDADRDDRGWGRGDDRGGPPNGDDWRGPPPPPNGGDWHRGGDNGPDSRPGGDGRDNGGDWRRGGDNGPPDNGGGRGDNGGRDQRGDNGGGGQINAIRVTSATYGATCHIPAGNVTKYLGDACNGKNVCSYTLQYQAMGGDPAPGCAKDFTVQWSCSFGPGGTASAPAEAGLGSKVMLKCEGR